jgi:hypothetical protein
MSKADELLDSIVDNLEEIFFSGESVIPSFQADLQEHSDELAKELGHESLEAVSSILQSVSRMEMAFLQHAEAASK